MKKKLPVARGVCAPVRPRLSRCGWALLPFVLAALLLGPAAEGAAQVLSPEIAASIQSAAEASRRHREIAAAQFEGGRGAPRLEAAAVAAISERPELTGAIVEQALRALPEAGPTLIASLSGRFPGFAGVIAAAAARAGGAPLAPERAALAEEVDVVVLGPVPRPENWPILPERGGADLYDDPLEGLNTVIHYVNGTLDFLIFEPLARGYRFLMPDLFKIPIRRAFDNLGLPVVFANDLLQLEFEQAGLTLSRFAVNSTLGIGGLFGVAEAMGLEPHDADFGQTLYLYGIGDGPYLVLPLFGPASLRDAAGIGVDSLMDPKNYLLGTVERLALGVGEGIVRREAVIEPVDYIKAYAQDTYAAVRAWTYQQRQRELAEGCLARTVIACPTP